MATKRGGRRALPLRKRFLKLYLSYFKTKNSSFCSPLKKNFLPIKCFSYDGGGVNNFLKTVCLFLNELLKNYFFDSLILVAPRQLNVYFDLFLLPKRELRYKISTLYYNIT